MHHKAHRLIDDKDLLILMHNIQWYVLRDNFLTLHLFIGIHDDFITRFYPIIRGNILVVHQYPSALYGFLHFISTRILYARHEELIQSQWLLTSIHYQTHSLI